MEPSVLVVVLGFLALLTMTGLLPYVVHRQRHATAMRASESAVSTASGEHLDAAEAVWAVRQVNESPHVRTLSDSKIHSAADVVRTIDETIAVLPPGHAEEIVQAQLRLERTSCLRAQLTSTTYRATADGPALADAAIISIGALVSEPTIASISELLLNQAADNALGSLADMDPVDHLADTMIGSASEHGAAAIAGIADAHLPVVTIITAIYSAKKSVDAGLDKGRAGENAAWDIGAKGGAIAAGSAIGTAVLPGVGTVLGALVGAFTGTAGASYGRRRHLRRALNEFRSVSSDVGTFITRAHLQQLIRESAAQVEAKQRRLADLRREYEREVAAQTWFQRTFRPRVGLYVLGRSIEIGTNDSEVDRLAHSGLAAVLSSQVTSAEQRAYVWVTANLLLDWAELDGPSVADLFDALVAVQHEQRLLHGEYDLPAPVNRFRPADPEDVILDPGVNDLQGEEALRAAEDQRIHLWDRKAISYDRYVARFGKSPYIDYQDIQRRRNGVLL